MLNPVEIVNMRTMYAIEDTPLQRVYCALVMRRVMEYLLIPHQHAYHHAAGTTIPETLESLALELGF
jgi:hypothetical protein